MHFSDNLATLLDQGVLDDIVRPLMSGKEAQVYLVVAGGEECVAKVYKEAQNRTFQARASYTEGRKVRNSRDQRAMSKRSKYGRAQDEAAWRSTEVDMIYRLRDAGVRVPAPYNYIDGILIMELVKGPDGQPAQRLADLTFTREEAQRIFDILLGEVVRMLCAGVVHGDLSGFNVLLAADGPVVIDFPQAVDAARNQNARSILMRDVDNLHQFAARFAPGRRALPYAQEMWRLYERGELTPTTKLVGQYAGPTGRADTHGVLDLIADAHLDERRRRERLGQRPPNSGFRERGPSRSAQPTRAPSVQYVSGLPRTPTSPSPANTQRSPNPQQAYPAQRPGGGHQAPSPQRLAPTHAHAAPLPPRGPNPHHEPHANVRAATPYHAPGQPGALGADGASGTPRRRRRRRGRGGPPRPNNSSN